MRPIQLAQRDRIARGPQIGRLLDRQEPDLTRAIRPAFDLGTPA